jgi:hypothetical protein
MMLIELNKPPAAEIKYHLRKSFTEGDTNDAALFWHARLFSPFRRSIEQFFGSYGLSFVGISGYAGGVAETRCFRRRVIAAVRGWVGVIKPHSHCEERRRESNLSLC